MVFLEDLEPYNIQLLEDDIVVVESSKEYVLWKNSNGKVNSEGYLILTGPNCSLVVRECFAISPSHDPEDNSVRRKLMWFSPLLCSDPGLDSLQTNYVLTRIGIMEVRFAVYSDGVGVQLEVILSDLDSELLLVVVRPLQVYGTVKAFNSVVTHSEAKSVLFDHITSQESVTLQQLDKGCDISLPLSRRRQFLGIQT